MNVYETSRLVHEYLLFHYGLDDEVLPYAFGPREALQFPLRTVHSIVDRQALPAGEISALDVGCAVGRSSFELGRFCHRVIGVDYSLAFIRAASELKLQGQRSYQMTEEGSRTRELLAKVPEDIDRSRVSFEVGDAHQLRAELGQFHLVHAANLLCRLHAPRLFLEQLPSLLVPGGQLLLTTPCTWLEEYTSPEQWLGGPPHNPQQTTLGSLQQLLEPRFKLESSMELPFLIRETARKFQWTVAQASRWTLIS